MNSVTDFQLELDELMRKIAELELELEVSNKNRAAAEIGEKIANGKLAKLQGEFSKFRREKNVIFRRRWDMCKKNLTTELYETELHYREAHLEIRRLLQHHHKAAWSIYNDRSSDNIRRHLAEACEGVVPKDRTDSFFQEVYEGSRDIQDGLRLP